MITDYDELQSKWMTRPDALVAGMARSASGPDPAQFQKILDRTFSDKLVLMFSVSLGQFEILIAWRDGTWRPLVGIRRKHPLNSKVLKDIENAIVWRKTITRREMDRMRAQDHKTQKDLQRKESEDFKDDCIDVVEDELARRRTYGMPSRKKFATW